MQALKAIDTALPFAMAAKALPKRESKDALEACFRLQLGFLTAVCPLNENRPLSWQARVRFSLAQACEACLTCTDGIASGMSYHVRNRPRTLMLQICQAAVDQGLFEEAKMLQLG